jgi:hypothetical protein
VSGAIVITGCDAAHYDLAADLLASLRDACVNQLTIGFIHVGDVPVPPAIEMVADQVVHVSDDRFLRDQRRGFRLAYLSVKARLPEFFPGYEVYVWLDGDTWVQNAEGLGQVIESARHGDVCMHPERDPNYTIQDHSRVYLSYVYGLLYGPDEASRYVDYASINSGVFAARATSPLWRLWLEALEEVRERAGERADIHFSDQIPLHRLVVSGRLTLAPLRAVNNWLTMLSLPAVNFERKKLLAPTYPFEEINIIHLIGDTKNKSYRLGDSGREITFRYRDIKALFGG